jgi:hypothetical protein
MAKNSFKKIKSEEPIINEAVVTEEVKSRAKASDNKITKSVADVFSGNFLTRDNTVKQLPFIIFLCVMAMGYIANSYYAERTVREINKVINEIKELRSEYITTKSDLMYLSKQSEVARAVQEIGLKESVVPPKKIVIETKIDTVKNK